MLETDRDHGLSQAEADERLAHWGLNTLPHLKRAGPLKRFALQFHSPLIYVLLAASGVTFAIGEHVDAGVILGVVIVIAAIGFIQESRAEEALESLRKMVRRTANVVRDGERRSIPSERLVPGVCCCSRLAHGGCRCPPRGCSRVSRSMSRR